jgi:hypothetical protein
MMRIRLRLLLTSFNKSAMDYALARLEVAAENPDAPSAPVVNRLGPHLRLDDDLSAKWPAAVDQVGAAADYIAAGNRGGLGIKQDAAWGRLARAVKMLGQFADGIEWIGVQPRANAAGEDGA